MDMLDALGLAIGEGVEAKDLDALQMGLRAAIIYIVTLVFVRIAKKRFLGSASAFDVVVGIIIGSIASRVITGNAPVVAGMTAAAVIVAMHWLFSGIALRSHAFGRMIKGDSQVLIENGEVDWRAMKRVHMTERDLDEALREKGLADVREVATAHLERDGSVSIIKR